MSRGLQILGGLLEGVGKGITAQANDVRARALRQMEIDAAAARQQEMIAAQHTEGEATRTAAATNTDKQIGSAKDLNTSSNTAAGERNAADITSREKVAGIERDTRLNTIRGLVTSDDGTVTPVTEGGKELPPLKAKSAVKDLPASVKFAIDKAIASAPKTVTKDIDGNSVTTINGDVVAAQLAKHPNKAVREMADMFRGSKLDPSTLTGPPDVENPPGSEGHDSGSAVVMPDRYAPTTRGLTGSAEAPLKAAAATQGDTPPEGKEKPAGYPNAVWSSKEGAWVVKKPNGKWAVVE